MTMLRTRVDQLAESVATNRTANTQTQKELARIVDTMMLTNETNKQMQAQLTMMVAASQTQINELSTSMKMVVDWIAKQNISSDTHSQTSQTHNDATIAQGHTPLQEEHLTGEAEATQGNRYRPLQRPPPMSPHTTTPTRGNLTADQKQSSTTEPTSNTMKNNVRSLPQPRAGQTRP